MLNIFGGDLNGQGMFDDPNSFDYQEDNSCYSPSNAGSWLVCFAGKRIKETKKAILYDFLLSNPRKTFFAQKWIPISRIKKTYDCKGAINLQHIVDMNCELVYIESWLMDEIIKEFKSLPNWKKSYKINHGY